MEIKTFIERAIEGGWSLDSQPSQEKGFISQRVRAINKMKYKERIFLDPKAWEAVGKVEGWKKEELCGACNLYLKEEGEEPCPQEGWKHKMLGMIDALIEGKTIEEYLKTL